MRRTTSALIPALLASTALLCASFAWNARADTVVWTAASGTDTNWSNGNNWLDTTTSTPGTAPGSADDVKFFNPGAGSAINIVSNVVDISFGGTIASLQYANTNLTTTPTNSHTTLIAPGQTLNVTGTNGLTAGTLTDAGSTEFMYASVKGAGGTLNVNNTAANIVVDQGRSANGNGTQRATLDMSGLDNFIANVNRIGVGSVAVGGGNNAQNTTGTLLLAKTNIITTSFAGSAITANTSTPVNALEVGANNGNNGGVNFLYLGETNAFFVDSVAVGTLKTTSSMLFNSIFTSPFAYFRGTNGTSSRIRFWTIGDMSSTGSSSANANGTNDFSGGTVDILVDAMSLGRDRSGGNTGATVTRGTLTFTAGTIDANLLWVGNQFFTAAGNSNPMQGVVNVNGASATLVVNTNLVLGNTTVNSTAAQKTSGILNINGGTVRANTISIGSFSLATNTITMNNGTLVVSNSVASAAKALALMTATNSTLQLNVTGIQNITVTNLVTGGSTNIIDPASIAVFPSYPTQIVLVKYQSPAINGAGYNFGFGANTLPLSAPNASLVNNTGNQSIDLLLPNDPRPVITSEPSSFSGNPNDTVNLSVGINPASVTPLTYEWFYYTNGGSTNLLANGAGPSGGSTVSGATTANLTITTAQIADSANYFVVISNQFGTATSSLAVVTISAGSPPNILGPNNQTVIQGHNATFSAIVSANPAADIRWERNGVDIPDATNSTLVVSNVQFPADDQAVFTIIATNSLGGATNSATLTVIVPPVVAVNPADLVVTNTQSASFTVVSTNGVPAPTYQWLKNNSPISPLLNSTATNATLVIASAAPSDMGTYSVTVANTAGSTTSAGAVLTVNSAGLQVVTLSPANGSSGVCYDTQLHITFSQAPVINTSGKVRIYNAANPATPVDTLDLTGGNPQFRTVGGVILNGYIAMVSSNSAIILPRSGVLTSNQTYFVTVDNGFFTDTVGANFQGITDTNAWRFTTKPTGPANPTNMVVAADGSGDFATVQGALDAIPSGNTNHILVNVGIGSYTEIVRVNTKHNITLRGSDRHQVVIAYPNNNNINGSTGTRPMFGVVGCNDIAIENLTLTNSTPHGGSQAEALRVGDGSHRFILFNADLDSFQDTLLVNNSGDTAYVQDSHIQGDTDYIWGSGTLYVTNCNLVSMTSGGHLTQARTLQGVNGFAFVNCLITGAANSDLGRDAGASGGIANFPYGQTAYINCTMDTNTIISGGWSLGSGTSQGSETANLRFWEYQSVDLTDSPVNTNSRVPWSLEIDGVTATNGVQNVTNWFSGWLPQLAPNILGQPANQSVSGGQSASFTVTATGIPNPNYQWLKDGSPITDATNATLSINNAHAGDVASYSVIVSNNAGSVTSASATLAVANTAPTLDPISDQTVNVGVVVSIQTVANDPDSPPQILSYSITTGPTNATISAGGLFEFRPLVTQANATYPVTIQVTDNGSPNLSASQSFNVNVNALTEPDVTTPHIVGGQFTLSVSGQTGPDYAVQVSTNLVNWDTAFITNSAVMPFNWSDPNTGLYQMRFYRIKVGPPLP